MINLIVSISIGLCFAKVTLGFPVEIPLWKNTTLGEVRVPWGKSMIIPCGSVDDNHNFLYWHVEKSNTVIGPDNSYDKSKYDFAVLSGNLTIQNITDNEDGVYNCVSRGVRSDNTQISTVRIVVKDDWEEDYVHDPKVNAFRILLAVASSVVFCGFIYVCYTIWRDRFKYPRYIAQLDENEGDDEAGEAEDSADELFRSPGPGPSTTTREKRENIVKNNSSPVAFENPSISTDFNSILDSNDRK